MSIKDLLQNIIDHHNNLDTKTHFYWHTKFGSDVDKIFHQSNFAQHHIGNFYRKSGLKIDLKKESEQSASLLKVMNFIIDGLTNDEDRVDRNISPDKNFSLKEDNKNYQSELLQYKQIYGDSGSKSRSLAQIDLPEEVEIKALAVSILSETDGNVTMAQNLLTMGGLQIIKKMGKEELHHLIGDLKSLASETNENIRR